MSSSRIVTRARRPTRGWGGDDPGGAVGDGAAPAGPGQQVVAAGGVAHARTDVAEAVGVHVQELDGEVAIGDGRDGEDHRAAGQVHEGARVWRVDDRRDEVRVLRLRAARGVVDLVDRAEVRRGRRVDVPLPQAAVHLQEREAVAEGRHAEPVSLVGPRFLVGRGDLLLQRLRVHADSDPVHQKGSISPIAVIAFRWVRNRGPQPRSATVGGRGGVSLVRPRLRCGPPERTERLGHTACRGGGGTGPVRRRQRWVTPSDRCWPRRWVSPSAPSR